MQEVTAGQGQGSPADVLSYVESCLLVLTFSRVSASGCNRVGVFELKPRHDLPDHSLQETARESRYPFAFGDRTIIPSYTHAPNASRVSVLPPRTIWARTYRWCPLCEPTPRTPLSPDAATGRGGVGGFVFAGAVLDVVEGGGPWVDHSLHQYPFSRLQDQEAGACRPCPAMGPPRAVTSLPAPLHLCTPNAHSRADLEDVIMKKANKQASKCLSKAMQDGQLQGMHASCNGNIFLASSLG